ncbi:recombinase family protein [Arthrobacter sp. ISL-65]|uniref:recombinase family protein n=1 Tax=Arthrobacter sp. ISL-65 TaxID=2819112 RepID=UPI0027DF3BE7|nr:recombinase family protein [Arthrobacter sp. ISL-65]
MTCLATYWVCKGKYPWSVAGFPSGCAWRSRGSACISGVRFRATQARMRWRECLDYLQPGNVLTVADLTRLGRSTADLADIVTVLGQRGIGFRSL